VLDIDFKRVELEIVLTNLFEISLQNNKRVAWGKTVLIGEGNMSNNNLEQTSTHRTNSKNSITSTFTSREVRG